MAVLRQCLWLLVAAQATATAAATSSYNFTQDAIGKGEAMTQLSADALRAAKALNAASGLNTTCTPDKVQVRKEW